MRSNRRGRVLATLLIALTATLTPGTADATPSARDVYIRDNATDSGVEPNTGTIYTSPDIRVCDVVPWCSGINPAPGTHNTVYVDLRRKRGASGSVGGRVDVYWTSQGGSATWASDWALIGSRYVSVPPGGTTAEIDWPVFPDGPVCLLARFVSDADPMTTSTPLGTGTQDDAKDNNNIAWRNLSQVRLAWPDFVIDRWPLVLRWPDPDPPPYWTDLVIEQPGRPFVGPGRLTIDLGQELATRWRDSGLRGEGVKLIDDTRVEVFSQGTARLQGLLVKPGEQLRTEVTFEAGPDLKGPYVLRVHQTDRQGIDAGGTEYRIN